MGNSSLKKSRYLLHQRDNSITNSDGQVQNSFTKEMFPEGSSFLKYNPFKTRVSRTIQREGALMCTVDHSKPVRPETKPLKHHRYIYRPETFQVGERKTKRRRGFLVQYVLACNRHWALGSSASLLRLLRSSFGNLIVPFAMRIPIHVCHPAQLLYNLANPRHRLWHPARS